MKRERMVGLPIEAVGSIGPYPTWRTAVKRSFLIALIVCVAACSVRPDGSNGQRRDFDVAGVSFEQAYRHADSYFRQCVRGFVGFSPNVTTGNIYATNSSAELQTINGGGAVVARVTITGNNAGSHIVVVTMRKAGVWNSKDLDAIETAVSTGTIVCK